MIEIFFSIRFIGSKSKEQNSRKRYKTLKQSGKQFLVLKIRPQSPNGLSMIQIASTMSTSDSNLKGIQVFVTGDFNTITLQLDSCKKSVCNLTILD